MALLLNTITFNHDPLSAVTSALNIRRNKLEEVVVPEYDRTNPRPQAASCAAYSLTETANQAVVVRVTFETTTPGDTYEVRATEGGVLGRLDPFVVSFPGASLVQSLDIPLTHRWFSVISRHDVTWEWSYRGTGNTAWQPLAATSHRIYLVLAVPSAPWVQEAGSPRLP